MFSANENITLRQDKRRIIALVEECIPEDALDMGTSVMVMQVSCRAQGCVPLETLVCIVFPKVGYELIQGLPDSKGGTFKTKILMPMAEVTHQDVLESLPPEFPGGQRSMSKLCLKVRDVMLSQVEQIMSDTQGKKLMAEYLQTCLTQYMENGCVPPEWGEEYKNDTKTEQLDEKKQEDAVIVANGAAAGKDATTTASQNAVGGNEKEHNKTEFPSGNFVVKRVLDDDETAPSPLVSNDSQTKMKSNAAASNNNKTETATDWRRRTNMQQQVSLSMQQQNIVARLEERQHEPGVRRPGCPCCDPDSTTNYVDSMMML